MRLSVKLRNLPAWFALAGLCACGAVAPDEALRRFVEMTVEATEARDTGHFRAVIADSFIDSHGNDRGRAIDLIRGFFFVNAQIDAGAAIVGVEWSGSESARVVLDVSIDGNASSVSSELELELLRDGSDWIVIGARWED